MGVRLVLSEHFSANELEEFAQAWDWVSEGSPQSMSNGGVVREWKSSSSPAFVRYVDDPDIDLRFLEITGDGTEDVASWVMLLLPVRGRGDLDAMVRSVIDPPSWIQLMYLAGIMGSLDFDPERFLILGNGLCHFDPQVRLAALRSVSYLDWPSFNKALGKISESDPDDDVRGMADRILTARRESRDLHGNPGEEDVGQ